MAAIDKLLKETFKGDLKKVQSFKRTRDKKTGAEEIFVYVDKITRWEALDKFKAYLKTKKITSNQLKDKRASGVDTLHVPSYNVFLIFKPTKMKGSGGRDFETQLATDLKNYFNGEKQLKHKDVIKELEGVIGIKPSDRIKIKPEGKQNKKRVMTFSGNKFVVNNSTGETLTDLTLLREKDDPIYLSLKMSQTYFIINGGVGIHFKNPTTRKAAYEYFGLKGGNGGMAEYGPDWAAQTSAPNYTQVKKNLEALVADAHGTNVVIVYKRAENDVFVSQTLDKKAKVVIKSLTEKNYYYLILNPKNGERRRAYTNIMCDARINKVDVTLHFQFRDGTEGGRVEPRYLRLMVKKH